MRSIRGVRGTTAGLGLAMLLGLIPAGSPLGGAEPEENGRLRDQAALRPYAGLVGSWRGTGQPQRGSTRGAWTETAEWSWTLDAESAALDLTIGKGKYLRSARLRPDGGPDSFRLDAVLADGATRGYSGKPGARKSLVFEAEEPAEEGPTRITLTPLHDTRFLLLLEASPPESSGRTRLAEVGYTLQGATFAAAGESHPICIVTEGRGTMAVSYQGKTYYVCCSGCKDLFEADPEAIIAEAAAREAARRP